MGIRKSGRRRREVGKEIKADKAAAKAAAAVAVGGEALCCYYNEEEKEGSENCYGSHCGGINDYAAADPAAAASQLPLPFVVMLFRLLRPRQQQQQ